MTLKSLAPAAVLILTAVGAGGCSDDAPAGPEELATVPAGGVLTYKGKPVANATVSFQSLDGTVSSYGRTDAAGTFTLSTYGEQDGAPPGKYKVTVAAGGATEIEPGVLAPEPPGGFRSPVPAKYADPDTTEIVVEVKEGEKNQFTIDLD
jgi:hypothetical protein